MAQKLLTYLPKEGEILMETMAQEWIEEGKDIGKKEGVQIGEASGKHEQQRLTAQRMHEAGQPASMIAFVLGIIESEVQSLLDETVDE